jgi:putative ABC transport system ATP-binding protein
VPGASTPAPIGVQGVTKVFELGHQRVAALDGLDVAVAPGEFVVFMGPSGSGKSTLLNLVGGLDRPTSGRILVGEDDIAQMDEIALASYRRRMVGFVFQSFNLISSMTALQNVEFPMLFAGLGRATRRSRAAALLAAVGLGPRSGHRPVELSGGEQQRVAIARAMANDPPILLGDEPTGNLDSRTGEEIMQLLSGLNRVGHTLLVVTHDTRIARFADRVVHMQDGKSLREEPGGGAVPSDTTRGAS